MNNLLEKKPFYKKVWFWVVVIFFIGLINLSANNNSDQVVNDKGKATVNKNQNDDLEVTEKEKDIPTEYLSALDKAESYANIMFMSKKGVYDQLISKYGEQFSKKAAQYAIDNVNANWKRNALEKAKSYQDSMSMSPNAIKQQLSSKYGEKFTREEAEYAVKHLND